ncbi:MAG: calcium-binding protein, partial [Solirubrobacterales bacterium]
VGPAAVNGGYVIRDGALPALLGRYIYADTYAVFGGELRTAQLTAGGSSGDSGLGVSATNVVSFGEDACAHIYVATLEGTVYRLEPTSGPFPCMPQNLPAAAVPPALAPPTCKGKPATILGTPGNDVRSGTPGRDVMLGLEGRDRLFGLGGNDVICGAKGKDTLKGGPGNDFLGGQKGDDNLLGNKGKDKLSGKKGRDRLKGGGGKDTLKGGGGRDVCIGGKANDSASKCEVEKSI